MCRLDAPHGHFKKCQLHSDGAKKSWKAMVNRQNSPNIESFHVSHAKTEFARKMKRRTTPKCVVAGTQCIDRFWQNLEDFVPLSLHSKEGPGLGVSPTLLTYVHAFLWRVNLPENVNMMKALGGMC